MKTKGITIWERKAEYFVLGIVALVLVVYLAGQFSSSHITDIDRDTVAPGDWNDKLRSTASAIRTKQKDPRLPEKVKAAIQQGEDLGTVDLPEFQGRMIARVGPASPSTIPGYRVLPNVVGGGDAVAVNSTFVDPELPAPTKPVVYQTFDLLADGVAQMYEQVQPIVGDTPHDITWLTVASEFNIAEALLRFRTTGPDGQSPLPDRWHANRVDLLDVRIERESLVDGQWTDNTLIAILPNQLSFRDRLAKHEELDAEDRDEILAAVVDPTTRALIYQPDFLSIQGYRWDLPEDIIETEMVEEAIAVDDQSSEDKVRDRDLRKLDKLVSKKIIAEELLKKEQASGLAGSGGSGGGSGGTRGAAGGGGKESPQIKMLIARIADLARQIEALRKKLGLDDDLSGTSEAPGVGSTGGPLVPSEQADEIWVWGHDLTIEAGSTYRYRVTLVVYNPLFARKLSLVEAQKHLAESLFKVVDSSPWSDQITAQPPLRVMAARAVPAGLGSSSGRMGYGEAVAEVWRFHGGQWLSRTFTVQPGDVIGRASLPDGQANSGMGPVDFSTGWYVVDVVQIPGARASDLRSGRGAKVVLQNLTDDRVMVIDPTSKLSKSRPDQGST